MLKIQKERSSPNVKGDSQSFVANLNLVCVGGAWKGIFKCSSNIDMKHVEYLNIFETLCHDHHVDTSFNFEYL